jgi:hypothetical protein
VQWYTRRPFYLLSEMPAGEFMSSLNDFDRVFSTGVEDPIFFINYIIVVHWKSCVSAKGGKIN